MLKKGLLKKLEVVEKMASISKIERMMKQPFKYAFAILFREIIYKKRKREKEVIGKTFFDTSMHLLLPSSTDIYLTGGKTHDSETRLARYLINSLNLSDTFIDIGAHYGYFSMLAATLVGKRGSVYSFEASPTTYSILTKNKTKFDNIIVKNLAVSDTHSDLIFYEFPNLYSEYNSLDIEQFKHEKWFSEAKPKEITIKGVILDEFLIENNIKPHIIKIDVEGAEFNVINGLKKYLLDNSPSIILEYLSDKRGNDAHKKAANLLESLGFQAQIINSKGEIEKVESVSQHIENQCIESDNIVFVKVI